MDSDIKNYKLLSKFNVSRETYNMLSIYRKLVIEKNREVNLISKKTEADFVKRHIIDCAQAIDFIDIKQKTYTDIGTGAGLPGLILAILLRGRNIKMKVQLYEKSYHKSNFLRDISKKLKLDTVIHEKNIFEEKNLTTGTIICRAFKPLPIVLNLIEKNFNNYSNLIYFMGKNGKQLLDDAIMKWEFKYKEIRSITNNDSFLLNIKKIKKNE